MAYSSGRLPSRFPVGTKFVIEGKRGGEGRYRFSAVIWNFLTVRFSRCRSGRRNGRWPRPGGVPIGRAHAKWPSANGRVTGSRSLAGRPAGFTVGHWLQAPRGQGPCCRPLAESQNENPSLRWAGVDGRSVNHLFKCLATDNAGGESQFPLPIRHPRQDRRGGSSRCGLCSQGSAARRRTTDL